MSIYLVCKVCGTSHDYPRETKLTGCDKCGTARYAVDDDGNYLMLWSEVENPFDFSPRLKA